MTKEYLQDFCMSLKGTTQDIKWGKDLCFCIGEKMYSVQGVEPDMHGASFKTTPEEFDHLISRPGIIPAPYVARYHWVLVENLDALSKSEWENYLRISYELVFQKLSKANQKKALDG